MKETMSSQLISTKLRKIAQKAKDYPDSVFTTLAHHMDLDFLYEAYLRTKKSGAPGIDRVTADEYAAYLEENLVNLFERLKSGKYRAPPVERVWLTKEDGSKRPIGKPTFEDKIVQRAVHMLMSAVYENDFYDFSYGFRPGVSPHKAIKDLRQHILATNARWIIDADISGFFDSIDHATLREFIRLRINDGSIIRLIGKWLNAGVMEAGRLSHSDSGTPQGGVISPLLANIFLHYVLDEWFVKMVIPKMKGGVFIVRFADDFIIGTERADDAKALMNVLPKRFSKYGLIIHPTKSRVVDFQKPDNTSGGGGGTFDFLGFTHYWGKSRKGKYFIKRKTAAKRLRRAKRSLWLWCRNEMHNGLKSVFDGVVLKLRGHYQYYGIRCNHHCLSSYYRWAREAIWHWLNRRSRSGKIPFYKFQKYVERFKLPEPRIVQNV